MTVSSVPGVEQGVSAKIPPETVAAGRPGQRRLTSLDVALLIAQILLIACHVLAAWLALGWVTAAAIDVVFGTYLLALCLKRTWRPVLGRLLAAGLVAGICELGTDAAGESVVHSLTYPPGAPTVWASPLYMPASWMLVLTLLGYLGWRLRGLGLGWRAVLVTGLVGGLVVPFYEQMAYAARWWRYATAPGVGHTPYYVMLFEAMVAAALPVLLARVEARPWPQAALRGLALGAWMPVAALAAWLAVGR